MFEKLFGKRSAVTLESDRIWKTLSLKLDGISRKDAKVAKRIKIYSE